MSKFGFLCKHFGDREETFRKALTKLCQDSFGQNLMQMENVDPGMIEEVRLTAFV